MYVCTYCVRCATFQTFYGLCISLCMHNNLWSYALKCRYNCIPLPLYIVHTYKYGGVDRVSHHSPISDEALHAPGLHP